MTGSAGSASGRATSWIIAVGDELLLGQTVDTNGAWMGARLAELGAPCVGRTVVGDVDDHMERALAEALERASVVLVCGGLGPTRDDRTRPVVARMLGRKMVEDSRVLDALKARYASEGDGAVPPANLALALVPEGAEPLLNPVGTAPGLSLSGPPRPDGGAPRLILLPGVPRELRALWPQVEDEIRQAAARELRPLYSRVIHTSGIPESRLAPQVEAALQAATAHDGVLASVAYLPDLTGVRIRLTTAAADASAAMEVLDTTEAVLGPVLDPWRIPGESGDMAHAVVAALKDRGWSLGLGESCTGGLVARRVTDVPGASSVFAGGVVAYANAVKTGLLQVPSALIEAYGAVSEPVALAMARGAATVLETTCGVGITGVAGPGGGTPEKPVGTVWIAVHTPGGSSAWLQVFKGDREAIRVRAAQAALRRLLNAIQGTGVSRTGEQGEGDES